MTLPLLTKPEDIHLKAPVLLITLHRNTISSPWQAKKTTHNAKVSLTLACQKN